MGNKMRHFVTGGAGFIGSHLVDRLDGEVTVYDNLSNGAISNIRCMDVMMRCGDIANTEALTECMKGHDIVWHLASNTSVPRGDEVTELDLKTSVIGTYNVLSAMRRNNIRKIVFTSSSSVYGNCSYASEYVPASPQSLYAAGKCGAEAYIQAFCHLHDVTAHIYRLGNVVGGRMRQGVVYDFIQKMKGNPKELEIRGDGKQEKNYIWVEDCVNALLGDRLPDIYNVSNETTITVDRIVDIVIEEMGLKNVKRSYIPDWDGDVTLIRLMPKIKLLYDSEQAVRMAVRSLL